MTIDAMGSANKIRILKRKKYLLWAIPLFLTLCIYLFFGTLLRWIGHWIVIDEQPVAADAVVVLHTGLEYPPRLIQAADIYHRGLAQTVVINGNRKTDSLRQLEARGFKPGCPWYADSLKILSLLGVPKDRVVTISAEDVYDTISEANTVKDELLHRSFKNIIITTSKFHTRRAKHIWKKVVQDKMTIQVVAADRDPYDPDRWWQSGRQIRWVLAEYGAWIFYWWKTAIMN